MIDFYKIEKDKKFKITPETLNCRCMLFSDDWYYNVKIEYKKDKIKNKYKGIKFYRND